MRGAVVWTVIALAAMAAPAWAQWPSVSNVSFSQSPNGSVGTKVDIYYDLASPNGNCTVSAKLSKDNGATFLFNVTTATGDIGPNIAPGSGKHIVWNVAADYADQNIAQARILILADDGVAFTAVPELLSVPAGDFSMGHRSDGDDATYGLDAELPVHTVALGAYSIGKYHITNAQYAAVLNWALGQGFLKTSAGAAWPGSGDVYAGGNLQLILALSQANCNIQYSGGAFAAKTRTGLPGTTVYAMDTHPVVRVSWYGAAAYCNWLSMILGLPTCYDMSTAGWPLAVAPPTSGGYRLPTEAEWERAAAWDGSKHWIYGFTSDTLSGKTHANYYDYTPNYLNPLGLSAMPYTSPVGWFNGVNISPNGSVQTLNSVSPAGCYDMTGNTWEWCHDFFLWTYYRDGGPPWSNPSGPGPVVGDYRVIRGGSWWDNGYNARTAYRSYDTAADTFYTIGFRIAKS